MEGPFGVVVVMKENERERESWEEKERLCCDALKATVGSGAGCE